MNKKRLIIAFFIAVSAIVNAENTPKSIVTSFGKALSAWCQSGDISYRIELEQLCNGVKKCRVEDKIHADYQIKNGLRDYKTFVLDSYLNMFQTLISGGIRFNMSNITVETQDHYPDGQTLTFITADIRVSGKLNYTVKDLFLVRDDKISGIYNYSSLLGFQHLNGRLIETLQKEEAIWSTDFLKGYAVVLNKEDKCGLIDRKGNIIVPFIWDALTYPGGDFVLGSNYKSDKGKSCSYDLRYGGKKVPFHNAEVFFVGEKEGWEAFIEGYAVVFNREGKYAYLKEDDYLYNNINYIYDEAGPFCEGYAYIKLKGRGAIINKRFEIVIQDDSDYKICSSFDEGLASVQNSKTHKYGFINTKGELVIPCVYDGVTRFYGGLCEVKRNDTPSRNPFCQTTQSGFINKEGELVIPISYWSCTSRGFENGYAAVTRINKNGLMESTLLGTDGNPLPGFSWYESIRVLSGGLARFKKNGKFGFLNSMGEVVIPPIYESASDFYLNNNRYACVGMGIEGKRKYGCINTDGILVIPYMYDSPFEFEDGVALVEKDNRLGLIDVYGNSTFFATRSKN